MSISPYLTFNGNCRQAMTFYQNCLGGELSFQTVGESPMAGHMPERMKNCILHATLTKSNFVLLGSDMVSGRGRRIGNSVAMMLDCRSEGDVRLFYEKLSEGGMQTHPLEHTFWGALFGDLTDKYGNPWLLHYQETSETATARL